MNQTPDLQTLLTTLSTTLSQLQTATAAPHDLAAQTAREDALMARITRLEAMLAAHSPGGIEAVLATVESRVRAEVESALEGVLENLDIENKVEEAVDNMDLDSKVEEALGNVDIEEKVREAVRSLTFTVEVQ